MIFLENIAKLFDTQKTGKSTCSRRRFKAKIKAKNPVVRDDSWMSYSLYLNGLLCDEQMEPFFTRLGGRIFY
jgi:hypothetical protein